MYQIIKNKLNNIFLNEKIKPRIIFKIKPRNKYDSWFYEYISFN